MRYWLLLGHWTQTAVKVSDSTSLWWWKSPSSPGTKHQQYVRSPRQLSQVSISTFSPARRGAWLTWVDCQRGRQKAHPCQKETLPVSESLNTEVLQLLGEKVPRRFYQGQNTHMFSSLLIFWEQPNYSGWNFLGEEVMGLLRAHTPPALEKTCRKQGLTNGKR